MLAPMIEARQLVKRHRSATGDAVTILDGAEFDIASGAFMALVGRSGTGKTTVLNLIGGLDRPDSGTVAVEGRRLDTLSDREMAVYRNRAVGFVFQGFRLRERRTAADNVAVPLMFGGLGVRESLDRARAALDDVGLGHLSASPAGRLSGGQKQRVAIARALVNRPRLLLADEPTGSLDTETGREIIALLRRMNERHGTTVVMVTHDPLVVAAGVPMLTVAEGKVIPFEGKL